ncbi:MAG: type 4a pilus biogenesis protein PilO [Patescibacteria group bacterium]|nr:type 4a pilus biogenesis protein PilO [Patescibacteria group bacterium]
METETSSSTVPETVTVSNMEEEKKEKSPIVKYLPVIIVVVVLSYGVGAYFLLFMPKIGHLMPGGSLDLKPLEARLGDYQAYLSRIIEEKEQFEQVHKDHVSKIPTILPDKPDEPNLYVQMDAIAQGNGLVLVSIDTVVDEATTGPHGVKKVRISLSLAGGTYQEFQNLLNDLERLVRVSDIESVTFSSGGTDYSVILTAYFIEPGFTPVQAAPTAPLLPDRI